MSFSEKIYRLLLRAYPREYRDRYAEPMEQLFRDGLRGSHTISEFVALWRRTLADWAVSVPARHRERLTTHISFGELSYPARRCIFFARSEASSFSRPEITLEHLLLGVLREEPSLLPRPALADVVQAIEANEPAPRRIPPSEDLRLSDAARRAIVAARATAARNGRAEIAPADLLAGIQRQGNTLAARLVAERFTGRG